MELDLTLDDLFVALQFLDRVPTTNARDARSLVTLIDRINAAGRKAAKTQVEGDNGLPEHSGDFD